jgi:uncharacterized YigZ family protein
MKTVKNETEIEFQEKKSKFIGYIKPINNKKEAEDFIKKIKKQHPNATHNCSVYSVSEKGQEYFKVDDDGEPSGTSGKPMGEILTYMGVTNLVIVATRYFGGIKLGAGGLIRNYAKTAKLAIQKSEIVDYVLTKRYVLDFSYEKSEEIDTVLRNEKIEIEKKEFSERVTYVVSLSENKVEIMEGINDIILFEY